MRWCDGRLTEDEAVIDPGLNGWGVFTTVGCQDGRPLLWDRHRKRLEASAEHLGAGTGAVLPEEDDLRSLLSAAGLGGPARLRVVVSKMNSDRWRVEASAAECGAIGHEVAPAQLTVERWDAASPLAEHKTLSRLPWDLARARAVAAGAEDALVVDSSNRVLETSIANVWMVRDQVVQTPPVQGRCLPGVMRGWLLENLDAAGFEVQERDIGISDLGDAEEMWLSNAVVGLRRVGSTPHNQWVSWPCFDRVTKIGIPAPGWPASARASLS